MSSPRNDAYAVLRIRDYRVFISGRFLMTFGVQMQSVIVGWQVYDLTKDVLSLGLIGLTEAIPFLVVALFAGYVADRHNRKTVMLLSVSTYLLGAITLLLYSLNISWFYSRFGVTPIFIVIGLTGITRAFFYPSQMALIAQIVPKKLYPNSSTWNSTIWHIAAVGGPAAGGLIYGFAGINAAYSAVVLFVMMSIVLFFSMKKYPMPAVRKDEKIFTNLAAGIRFVKNNPVILGSMSLDMFAVLFGGAVALLPVFAADILKTGPEGLGFLRAAPAFGAVFTSFVLAHRPVTRNAGQILLISVAGFGACIILFALSTNYLLSLSMLLLSGVFDNVSVVIRSTIIQLFTPDEMRGRVASVNSIFVGSSNEIGSFESGVAARIMGLVPSVIFGGGMTLGITALMAWKATDLRKLSLEIN